MQLKLRCLIWGALGALLTFSVNAQEITFYDWDGRGDLSSIYAEFEQETGIKVNLKTFTASQDMYELISNEQMDVSIVLNYDAKRLIDNHKIIKLDSSQMPSYKNVNQIIFDKLKQRNLADYVAPYLAGVLVLVVDENKVKTHLNLDAINTWRIFFDAAYLAKLQNCGVSFFNSPFQVFSIYSLYKGYLSNLNENDLRKTGKGLSELAPFYRDPNKPNNDACVSLSWSTYPLALMQKEGRKMLAADESTLMFVNTFVISKKSKNVANVHKFIDFMLRPNINAKIVELTQSMPVVRGVKELVSNDYSSIKEAFPSDKELRRFTIFDNSNDELDQVLNAEWSKFISKIK